MKILIAEDEYTTRLMVQVCLENWGYSIESVEDGKTAWDIINQKNPPQIAVQENQEYGSQQSDSRHSTDRP